MADRQKSSGLRSQLELTGFLTELMFALLLEAALLVAANALAPGQVLALSLAVAVCLFGFWVLRVAGRRIWHLLLPSLLLIVGPLMISGIGFWPKLLFALSMLAVNIRTMALRLRGYDDHSVEPNPSGLIAPLGWLLLADLAAGWLVLPAVVSTIFYFGVAYLLIFIFKRHYVALSNRMARFLNLSTQPTGRILKLNRLLLVGFAAGLLIVLLAARFLHLDSALPLLGSLLLAAVRQIFQWLISLFKTDGQPAPTETTVPDPTETGGFPPDNTELPALLAVLQEIFYYLLLAGAIVAILAGLIWVIYSIYRKFYETRSSGPDLLEDLAPRLSREIAERINRSRSQLTLHFGRSPELKIRRAYFRLVMACARQGLEISPALSPRLIQVAAAGNTDVLAELTGLYEKARYGPGLCTIDDARRMMDLCRIYRLKQE